MEKTETKIALYPYKSASKSAKLLSKTLGVDFTRRKLETYIGGLARPDPNSILLINWGCNSIPGWTRDFFKSRTIINSPNAVGKCGNKLRFFQTVSDKVRIPEFTTNFEEAMKWMLDGTQVLGRKTSGSCGLDITFNNGDPEKFSGSDFWVKYKKKKAEFRIHIMGGDLLFAQKKVLRSVDLDGQPVDKTKIDFRVRNHANGFIFQRNDVNPPADVVEQARIAVEVVKLDFGAVDVIWNEAEGKAYVLEINTAPGLEGSSVDDYTNGLKKLVEKVRASV